MYVATLTVSVDCTFSAGMNPAGGEFCAWVGAGIRARAKARLGLGLGRLALGLGRRLGLGGKG